MLPRQKQFVRPLLTLTKGEIIEYMTARGLEWREDPSNADSHAYMRNAVRHNLVPTMNRLTGSREALYK